MSIRNFLPGFINISSIAKSSHRYTHVIPQLANNSYKGTCVFRHKTRRFSSIYEPEGLDYVPEIPEYEELNLRLRGYDYVVLESFTKYVHNLIRVLGHEQVSWAVPARKSQVQTFKPGGTQVKETYNLSVYERTLQVQNLPSTAAPMLFEVIRQNLPEGVHFTAKEPDEVEEEFRYVPDVILRELRSQVEEIDILKDDRKKK